MKKAGVFYFFIIITMVSAANAQTKQKWGATEKDTDRMTEAAVDLVKERSRLAKTYIKPNSPVNEETAKKICIAVSEKARKFVEDHKTEDGVSIYEVKFVSEKFRNPSNVPDDDERKYMKLFNESREKVDNWDSAYIGDRYYYRYMLPIFAEKPCLACHGEKKKLPGFVGKMYTDDRSYGFKEGDLMGAVAVFTWKGF